MSKTIVYIAGTGRCGSTLLEMILSQLPGVLSVGEIRYLKERGFEQNRKTGEGVEFKQSPFWTKWVEHLYNGDWQEAEQEALSCPLRMRQLLWPRVFRKSTRFESILSRYGQYYHKVFSGLFDVSNADVIIDSSKIPTHGLAFSNFSDMQVKILHLKRDPRAVAYSWNKSKYDQGKGGMMSRKNILSSSLEWAFINDWIGHYFKPSFEVFEIDYAELTHNPHQEINKVIEFINPTLKSHNPIKPKGNSYEFKTSHPTVSGNPIRFDTGRIEIREDRRWKESMPMYQRALVNFVIKTLGLIGLDGQGGTRFV